MSAKEEEDEEEGTCLDSVLLPDCVKRGRFETELNKNFNNESSTWIFFSAQQTAFCIFLHKSIFFLFFFCFVYSKNSIFIILIYLFKLTVFIEILTTFNKFLK